MNDVQEWTTINLQRQILACREPAVVGSAYCGTHKVRGAYWTT